MSTTTRGEAAYLNGMLTNKAQIAAFDAIIEKERSAERRATVERIRAGIEAMPYDVPDGIWNRLVAILDEEVAR